LKQPRDLEDPSATLEEKVQTLFRVLGIDLLCMMALMGLLAALSEWGVVPVEENHLAEILEQIPVPALLGLGILLIPMLEELIFRSYLRFEANYLLQPMLLLLGFVTDREALTQSVRQGWDYWYPVIFFASAVIFGLVHITNYSLTPEVLLWTPVLVLPQVVAGLFMGYLRVRFGFIWGFFLHALHNFAFLGIPLLVFGKEAFV